MRRAWQVCTRQLTDMLCLLQANASRRAKLLQDAGPATRSGAASAAGQLCVLEVTPLLHCKHIAVCTRCCACFKTVIRSLRSPGSCWYRSAVGCHSLPNHLLLWQHQLLNKSESSRTSSCCAVASSTPPLPRIGFQCSAAASPSTSSTPLLQHSEILLSPSVWHSGLQ